MIDSHKESIFFQERKIDSHKDLSESIANEEQNRNTKEQS